VVIVAGGANSGKTTLISTLKDPLAFAQPLTLLSTTREVSIGFANINESLQKNSSEEETTEKENFVIVFADTPGFEIKDTDNASQIEAVEDVVLTCRTAGVTDCNTILYTIAYNKLGVNPQDIELFGNFVSLLNGCQKNVHIVVTKSEWLSVELKEKFELDLKGCLEKSEVLKELNFNPKIYFIGAVEEKWSKEAVKLARSNVAELRKQILLDISTESSSIKLESLKITENIRLKATILKEALGMQFENKDDIKDVQMFKACCIKLSSWMPVLEQKTSEGVLKFLTDCDQYLKNAEKSKNLRELIKNKKNARTRR